MVTLARLGDCHYHVSVADLTLGLQQTLGRWTWYSTFTVDKAVVLNLYPEGCCSVTRLGRRQQV